MKIKIDMPIIVEGKYDINHIKQIFDAVVIATNGFSLFKDKAKMDMIRNLSEKTGIIILTDSDSAGLLIRNHIKSFIDGGKIINAYIPDIFGKESRKDNASKEGKIGVEGIDKQIIIAAFENAGAIAKNTLDKDLKITKNDLYDLGLIGVDGSLKKRLQVLKLFNLPENLSTNAMIEILNITTDLEEFICKIKMLS